MHLRAKKIDQDSAEGEELQESDEAFGAMGNWLEKLHHFIICAMVKSRIFLGGFLPLMTESL